MSQEARDWLATKGYDRAMGHVQWDASFRTT
nr:ATP-dependent Clp protease ATP-binding subunit ClpA [Klebsiella pneumoniae]